MRLPLLLGALLASGGPALLHAGGGAPLTTEDPGTPGPGRWEINLGVATERRPGVRLSALPSLDLNYGVGETMQLKFEVPWLAQYEDGRAGVSGLGNSLFGVKWRVHAGGDDGLSFSVFPRVEFNNPGSSSADRGLVGHGSVLGLPVQLEKAWGPVALNLQFGREFGPGADLWSYGAALRRRIHARCEIAAELVGTAASGFGRSQLMANLCFAVDVGERASLLVAAGRELHNHEEPRATLIGYVGWQLRR